MDTTKTHTRPRLKLHAASGKHSTSLNIDPISRSRAHHAVHLVTHTLNVPCNVSSIARLGIEMYRAHIEAVGRLLATLPEDSEEYRTLRALESDRVNRANQQGGKL